MHQKSALIIQMVFFGANTQGIHLFLLRKINRLHPDKDGI